jgi:probable F420-dependent oxidoreductase
MIPKPVAIVPEKILPAHPDRIAEYAMAVEEMGYWGVTAKDHVVLGREPDGNNQYTNEHSFVEPMTLFAFMAGITRRMKMITGVLVLPQRPTALVAKTAQAVSDLSGGRLILGVGVGSNKTEFNAMGAEFAKRGKRMDEQLVALKSLWSRPYTDLSAGSERGRNIGINPRPRHEIPLWVGGWAHAALERTARFADGWAPMGHPADAKPLLPVLHGLLEEHGRDPSQFDLFGAFSTSRRGTQVPDTMDQRALDLRQWMDMGATAVAYGRQDSEIPVAEALDRHLDDLEKHMEMFIRVTGYKPV